MYVITGLLSTDPIIRASLCFDHSDFTDFTILLQDLLHHFFIISNNLKYSKESHNQ